MGNARLAEPLEQRRAELRVDLLACPKCRGTLQTAQTGLNCPRCAKSYQAAGPIPLFAQPDSFYDEYALVHCPFAASPAGLKGMILKFLPFWSWREWRFWNRVIPPCDRLLDFGCGRGRGVFIERARETVGYDGSLAFLRECPYTTVALGQLPYLPFRSGIFNVVVSSHALGHVPFEHKDVLVSEIARVLKPGGLTVHIVETDSNHPAVLAAKQNREAYQAQFIGQHGHVGLEPAQRVIERFERHGFQLRVLRLVDAILPSVMNYRVFFDVPAYQHLPQVRWSCRLSRLTAANRVFNAAYEVGMGTFHRTIEQWFGRPERAQFIHVVLEKVTG